MYRFPVQRTISSILKQLMINIHSNMMHLLYFRLQMFTSNNVCKKQFVQRYCYTTLLENITKFYTPLSPPPHSLQGNNQRGQILHAWCISRVAIRARDIVRFASPGPILKLKTGLFLDKKLKIVHKTLYFSRLCDTQTDIVTCQNCSHLIICCYLS